MRRRTIETIAALLAAILPIGSTVPATRIGRIDYKGLPEPVPIGRGVMEQLVDAEFTPYRTADGLVLEAEGVTQRTHVHRVNLYHISHDLRLHKLKSKPAGAAEITCFGRKIPIKGLKYKTVTYRWAANEILQYTAQRCTDTRLTSLKIRTKRLPGRVLAEIAGLGTIELFFHDVNRDGREDLFIINQYFCEVTDEVYCLLGG